MNANYTLRYRTFESVLDDIRIDMPNFAAEGKIDAAQLIKVARLTNYKMGLRILQSKEQAIEVRNYRARLPEDFFVLNYAFLCGKYTVITMPAQGNIIETVLPPYRQIPELLDCGMVEPVCEPTPVVTGTCLTKCGTEYKLIQHLNWQSREYKDFARVRFINSKDIDCDCPNVKMRWNTPYTASIKDGFVDTSFESGTLYINYQGSMVDAEGNLLVPDHEILNEYTEYALKQRIVENAILNGEQVDQAIVQLIEARLVPARRAARSLVTMPNFSEMAKLWAMNRRAQYARFYDMFKSRTTWLDTMPIDNAL